MYALTQSILNSFNASTAIGFALPENQFMQMTINILLCRKAQT